MNTTVLAVKLLSEEIEKLQQTVLKHANSKVNQPYGSEESKQTDILLDELLEAFDRLKGMVSS